MDVSRLAQRLSSDGNACRRRLSLCYFLGVPKEEVADIASKNHVDFFSQLLENWIRRNDNWNLEGLNYALTQIGAATLEKPSLPEAVDEDDSNSGNEATNQVQVQLVRPSVLQTHGVGELPSTSSGAHLVSDIAEAAPVIRHIKFEFQHGIQAAQYSSLSERCLSPSCPAQPFQPWEIVKQDDERLEATSPQQEELVVTSESESECTTDSSTDLVIEFEPESKPKIPTGKPTSLNTTNIIQFLELLDQQNSSFPERGGLDIPRIASLLSANKIAYNKREIICYHLGIPKEDLQFIISLSPYQFFTKLLWSWELRDDAWAEIRLARALDHIGIHDDSNHSFVEVADAETNSTIKEPTTESDDAEPCTKRPKNQSDPEYQTESNPDTASLCSTQTDMELGEPASNLKKAKSRAKKLMTTSKVFGSRKRLVGMEPKKHYLELTRSFDRNRNSNSMKVAKLSKFVSMYLKATLKIIESIPTAERRAIDDAPTIEVLQNTKNDFKTAKRVYKQSRLLKKNILKRKQSNIKSECREARSALLQTETISGISSCHI